jgi:hypothetical protein
MARRGFHGGFDEQFPDEGEPEKLYRPLAEL